MDIIQAKKIFQKNFIGPDELGALANKLRIKKLTGDNVSAVPLTIGQAQKISKHYVLIWGIPRHRDGRPLTIVSLRSIFGANPVRREPCFYAQDWYLAEDFARRTTLAPQWHLIRKAVIQSSRGRQPERLNRLLPPHEDFPLAILAAFTFFSCYLLSGGEILWPHDFIWCADKDGNGDRIYAGRYLDPQKKSKNGFNIHRHLSVRSCYGLAPTLNL